MTKRSTDNEKTRSESLSFVLILKKLINLGKVDLKDVAAEIGVNPDALNTKLMDGDLLPDLLGKIIKWLSQHAHMGTRNKCESFRSTNTTKPERRAAICTEDTVMLDSDIVDPGVLERTSAENCTGNGFVADETKAKMPVLKKEISEILPSDHSSKEKKSVVLHQECHLGKDSVHISDDHGGKSNPSSSGVMVENAFSLGPNSSQNRGILNCPSPIILDLLDHEAYPGFNPHPYISKELSEMGSTDSYVDRKTTEPDGSEERTKHLQDTGDQRAECGDTFCQLAKARKLGILDTSPKDEVEGELLYYQLQLLGTAVSRKQLSVTRKLPLEIDEEHGRRWDDVLVNKYFHDVREARKQGRKEKRHKEAQAVLAAATAAAATSSRNTSPRKDMTEEPAQQEMSTYRRKVTGSGHLVPQTKETLLKVPVSGPPSEKRSDQRTLENPRSCDICRRSETIWNLIVVCSSCNVELERLRLLCERMVKREKLKRELAISSHEILAARRDHAARSLPDRNLFSPSEVSSDSATTSIRGYPDSNISGSEAIQRSNDITIDSTASVKQQRGICPDQKTDDSATSKGNQPTESQVFSGKTVPRKHCIVSPSVSEEGDEESKTKKHVETFAKELVMTSDEASFKNRRLPKGYFYVPVDRLQEDKLGNEKSDSSDKQN